MVECGWRALYGYGVRVRCTVAEVVLAAWPMAEAKWPIQSRVADSKPMDKS